VEKHWNASGCNCTRSRAYREEVTDVEFISIRNMISMKLLVTYHRKKLDPFSYISVCSNKAIIIIIIINHTKI